MFCSALYLTMCEKTFNLFGKTFVVCHLLPRIWYEDIYYFWVRFPSVDVTRFLSQATDDALSWKRLFILWKMIRADWQSRCVAVKYWYATCAKQGRPGAGALPSLPCYKGATGTGAPFSIIRKFMAWSDCSTNPIEYDYLPPARLRLRTNKITITLKVITITIAITFVLKHPQKENKTHLHSFM